MRENAKLRQALVDLAASDHVQASLDEAQVGGKPVAPGSIAKACAAYLKAIGTHCQTEGGPNEAMMVELALTLGEFAVTLACAYGGHDDQG